MTQSDLDNFSQTITDAVQMWANGLVTDREFAQYMANLWTEAKTQMEDADLDGLLDPNTGLRYPTE